MATILVGAAVLAVTVLAIRSTLRSRKQGGCGCGCDHCAHASDGCQSNHN